MPVLYLALFGTSVVRLIPRKLWLYNTLTLRKFAYPSLLGESDADPMNGGRASMPAKRLICTLAVALIASHGVHAQPSTDVPITRFPSPYMHAKDTPLVTLDNGAKVSRETTDVKVA
jgi:hypothetical protein